MTTYTATDLDVCGRVAFDDSADTNHAHAADVRAALALMGAAHAAGLKAALTSERGVNGFPLVTVSGPDRDALARFLTDEYTGDPDVDHLID